MSYYHELFSTAKRLIDGDQGDAPTPSDINRAVSTCYYAMFDWVCSKVADRVVGTQDIGDMPNDAWVRVYRSFDHKHILKVFKNLKTSDSSKLRSFAVTFQKLYDARTEADYARNRIFGLEEAKQLYSEAFPTTVFLHVPERRKKNLPSMYDGSTHEEPDADFPVELKAEFDTLRQELDWLILSLLDIKERN